MEFWVWEALEVLLRSQCCSVKKFTDFHGARNYIIICSNSYVTVRNVIRVVQAMHCRPHSRVRTCGLAHVGHPQRLLNIFITFAAIWRYAGTRFVFAEAIPVWLIFICSGEKVNSEMLVYICWRHQRGYHSLIVLSTVVCLTGGTNVSTLMLRWSHVEMCSNGGCLVGKRRSGGRKTEFSSLWESCRISK
jgi:hypothetical protein